MKRLALLLAFVCAVPAWAQDEPKTTPLDQARARNAALQKESTRRDERIARNKERIDDLATRVQRATATLERVKKWYAPDTLDYERPSDEEVLVTLRQLELETDPVEFERARDRVMDDRAALDKRRSEIDAARAALDETFAPLVEQDADAAATIRLERERLLSRLRKQCTELLKQDFKILEQMTAEQRAKRAAFLFLRQENLFLRGRSTMTRESLERARSDLADLPGWFAYAGRSIWSYLTDRAHLMPLLQLAGLLSVVFIVLFLIGRGLRSRHAHIAPTKAVQRRLLGVLAASAPPFTAALLVWLAAFGASSMLPDLGPGVSAFLRAGAWLLGGIFLLRAVAARLCTPRETDDGDPILPAAGARRLAFGIRLVVWISAVMVPVILALEYLGYENEGAREAIRLGYETLLGLVTIFVLLRKRFLESLLPSENTRGANLLRFAVAYLRPVLVLLVPILLILDALSYDILASLIFRFSLGAVVALIAFAILHRVGLSLADAWLEKSYAKATVDTRNAATDALHFGLRVAVALLALWAFLRLSGSDLDELRSFFEIPLPLQSADKASPITWWGVIVALVLFYVFLRAVSPARQFLHEIILRKASMDEGLRYAISTLFGYALLAGGVYVALQQVVDLSNLGYLVAALSVGLGFGLQEIVSNFVSGLILLFERPLKVGDLIQVGDKQGVVRRINIRATTVQTLDNIYLLVPNREFITQTVVNFAHDDPKLRIHVGVGVSYSSDTSLVRETLLEVAKANARVLDRPAPIVRFLGFGDSSLNFELLAWVARPQQQHDIGSDLCFDIFEAFNAAGINIPFPQRDLHVRSIVPASVAGALGAKPQADEPEPEKPDAD